MTMRPPLSAPARWICALRRLPRFERSLLVPTWLLLGLMRAAVLGLGFPRLAPWLGSSLPAPPPLPALDARAQRRALQIGRTLRLAARHTPWESNCLTQALTARCLLGGFGIAHVVCFGMARQAGASQLEAHAWVTAGALHITGGADIGRFTRVACFVPRAWRTR